MIIFNLDGTLANCEHRRHFVDATKSVNHLLQGYDSSGKMIEDRNIYLNIIDGKRFKPDWKSFYEGCDKDLPIEPVINIWDSKIALGAMGEYQIWSGRCESVREQTEKWLSENLFCFESHQLKMRPIGDYTPDDQLKERWLDEYIDSMYEKLKKDTRKNTLLQRKNSIEMVFDSDTRSMQMWIRRGIFVFDVSQGKGDF